MARRVELTQNALHRYVDSKDELLMLAAGAAFGDGPQPDPRSGWRANASAWAGALLDRCLARPWLLDIPVHPPVTRNALLWTSALVRGMADSGLDVYERVESALLLDGHTRTIAAMARDLSVDQPAYSPELAADRP